MNFIIEIQFALKQPDFTLPKKKIIKQWLSYALAKFKKKAEISVRIVEDDEITTLNKLYRHKNQPTNVLAFPSVLPKDVELEYELLGDIVIAANVVKQEAMAHNKHLDAHFAHMLIHGLLHLLGFDHKNDKEAKIMEQHEINILQELNFNNPYHNN